MAMQNAQVSNGTGIAFRIGIHVGDIIIDENDIFGDGVNIAARLEGIAEPGGVCISDDAHRQIRGKVDIAFIFQVATCAPQLGFSVFLRSGTRLKTEQTSLYFTVFLTI
jgi:class 3 adenylate cyclase